MKKTIFFAVFLWTAISLFGQRPHHPHHGNLIEKFKEDLKLTEAQETQIEALHEEFRAEMKGNREAARKNENVDHHAMREKMHEKKKAHHEQIMAILTTEQQEILKAKKEAFHSKRKERMEKVDFQAMKEEARAYRDKNIKPIMLEQRTKLETQLSEEDKVTIAELRPIFEKVRSEKMAMRKDFKKGKEKPSPEMHQQKMEEHKAFREKYKSEHETMKSLVEKYDDEIEKLFAETKSQQEKWKADLQEIHGKYMPERGGDEHFRGHRESLKHGGKSHFNKGFGKKKSHFLLLDPNKPAESTSSFGAVKNISNFPNPATEVNTLNYEITLAGNVRIELRNEKGDVIRVVENRFKEIGKYSVEVDLSAVRDGVYYYTIIEGDKLISEKIIKNGGR